MAIIVCDVRQGVIQNWHGVRLIRCAKSCVCVFFTTDIIKKVRCIYFRRLRNVEMNSSWRTLLLRQSFLQHVGIYQGIRGT